MEQQLITTIKSMVTDPSLIGDDCAVIKIANEDYLFTMDNFVEDVHYSTKYFSTEDVGWKALAVNISDIAAMAGQPLFVLVGLSLSETIEDKEQWIKDFYNGLNQCASKFGNPKVIGGDITASKSKTMISIAMVGKTSNARMRSSAKPGDLICVTGSFGETGVILNKVKDPDWIASPTARNDAMKHLRPEPRLEQAQRLPKDAALMDASDGLAQALFEIAEQSGVDIEIDSSLIPCAEGVNLEQALYGGEDYELVAACKEAPDGFTVIGKSLAGTGCLYLDSRILRKDKIYQHFKA